jgi:ribonuclease HII
MFISGSTRTSTVQVGTDEAGKGPVLGSMFAAAVRADPEVLPDGVADSKELSVPRREELATEIRDRATATAVVEVPVERIDNPDTDMNGLTVTAHADALAAVTGDESPAQTDSPTGEAVEQENEPGVTVYLDAADTNAVRFERRVGKQLDSALDLRAEHAADETYPVVAAASILAKVSRDAHVADLAAEYGEVGSGYPGDPTTRKFLRAFVGEHNRLPDCARTVWQTSRDVLAERGQAALSDFERDDRQDQRSLSEF